MTDFLIKSTISLTVFLVFYHLVLEREKIHQFNRFYLLFSIVISFIIPFITFEITQIVPIVQNNKAINLVTFPITTKEISFEEKINYLSYMFFSLYGIISFLLLIRFVNNCFKLLAKSKSNPTIKYKNANLVLIEEKTLPYTFLNSIFINFEDYNNRTIEEELYSHELVHVTQKHSLDILFIEFLKVIFWFNPLLIFYKKAIQLNHEFLADEEIVKTYNNVPFYQNLLLQKGFGTQTIYLASNLNYLVTKKRLIMMTKCTSKKIAILKKIATIPIMCGLLFFLCLKTIAQEKIISVKEKHNPKRVTNVLQKKKATIKKKKTISKPKPTYCPEVPIKKEKDAKLVDCINSDIKNLNEVTQKPEYEDGIKEFFNYIGKNFKIPEDAKKQKVKGIIFVDFIIEKDGTLTNVNIIKDLGFGTGEEAKRVLENTPKWSPGKIENEIVRVKYVLPIKLETE
jgi:beta-lactamase regulating signal transducer with metallopeptidase domain